MRRKRQITPGERELWAYAVRDAAPLPGRTVDAPPPRPPPRAARAESAPAARPAAGRHVVQPFDRHDAQRLRRGQLAIEARLDLHGLTEAEAHHAVDRFVELCWSAGRRVVLVITGKGGVLRALLPRWLAASRHHGRVLALSAAAPRHGGEGAYYLRLRRRHA
jgi:DNA-nicking Smr family endonuclease